MPAAKEAVLVVHPDAAVRQGLTGALGRRGRALSEARDREDALAIMSAHPAAVLIVASQLPSGSYRALLDAIERPPPTIVLGALAGIEQTTAADDERVISVLAQPWRPRDLYDAIEAADRNSDTAATDADEKLRRASQAAEAQGSV